MSTPTVIEAIKTFIDTSYLLADAAPLWVNHLGTSPGEYSIVPLPGGGLVEPNIIGGGTWEFPFAFRGVKSTNTELERLESIGFFEIFAAWMKEQSDAGNLPVLGADRQAEEIMALDWGYLYEEGESKTGIYQIVCKLVFEQSA